MRNIIENIARQQALNDFVKKYQAHGVPIPSAPMHAMSHQMPAHEAITPMPIQQQMQQEGPDFQMEQQPEMMQQEAPQNDPIARGASNATRNARHSLEMSDAQNSRALGNALIHFSSGMAKNPPPVGSGFAGALGMINAGFAPALEGYNKQRERIQDEMLAVKKLEAAEREEERAMKKQAHDIQMAEKEYALKRQIHSDTYALKQQEAEEEKALNAELGKPGGRVPMAALKGTQWNLVQHELKEYGKQAEKAFDQVSEIRAAKEILKDDPNITKYASTIMLAAQRRDPTIVQQTLNHFWISDKDRYNAERLSKHLSKIFTSGVEGAPAKGMNMFLEKEYKQSVPDFTMHAPAMTALLNHDEEHAMRIYDSRVEALEEAKNGYFKRVEPPKFKKLDEKRKIDASKKPISELSDQELMEKLGVK